MLNQDLWLASVLCCNWANCLSLSVMHVSLKSDSDIAVDSNDFVVTTVAEVSVAAMVGCAVSINSSDVNFSVVS